MRWAIGAVWCQVHPPHAVMSADAMSAIRNAKGLEIGGPSAVFGRGGMLPVYREAARIDNVNFAHSTAWETKLQDGGVFRFDPRREPGTQWIKEASSLGDIASGSYDFVLSSHCLEHLANPLPALREWTRVTRAGGHLFLVLPDPARSFDHKRPITSMAHLNQDELDRVSEDDLTHAAEVLALHDLGRDPEAGTAAEFRARVMQNPENRCLHHHVFDLDLIHAVLEEAGWRVHMKERVRPVHLLAWARKGRP